MLIRWSVRQASLIAAHCEQWDADGKVQAANAHQRRAGDALTKTAEITAAPPSP
jgi:hypothetical protein